MNSFLICLPAILVTAGLYQAAKICQFGSILTPAAVITYALTFMATDILAEVYGKRVAKRAVAYGFYALLITLLTNYIAVLLPKAPWFDDKAFNAIMFSSGRIALGSIVAYLVSQYHDVWLFHLLKEKTHGRHLWLRNNVSTIVSQAIDTTIFITIAFYGVVPHIGNLILGQWLVKVLVALCDTIPVYIVSDWLKRRQNRTSLIIERSEL